jgi:hypothetical protein
MSAEPFRYRVTDGWLRDLASQPTPRDAWPSIGWDEQVAQDQVAFLDAQEQLGVDCNVVWGLFVDRAWPVPFQNIISEERAGRLRGFVEAAGARKVRVMSGLGVYSWGFEEVIRKVPEVGGGGSVQAMCLQSSAAWDWMRRVMDFLMEPRWGLGGVSMQSADQGRCGCEKCARIPAAQYHAEALIRCAQYIRAARPDWVIGQAAWGLNLDAPEDIGVLEEISKHVDYMVEVQERTARAGRRREIVGRLRCAFGSVGGVFIEPPQHWERLRWFVPCGLSSAKALAALWNDGGRACEYFYRPFANPGEEVSWRTAAAILSAPQMAPEKALRNAIAAVYAPDADALDVLAGAYAAAEAAYFSRSTFQLGDGSLSLEPLVSDSVGPPVYLTKSFPREALADYAGELRAIAKSIAPLKVGRPERLRDTLTCIDGTLRDIATAG